MFRFISLHTILKKMRVSFYVFVFVFAKTGEGIEYGIYDSYANLKKMDNRQQFDEPVPFGHITREGFGDPFSPVKQPLDRLELSMRMPKDNKEALDMLRKAKAPNILFLRQAMPKIFTNPSPKDEMLLERFINPVKETNETMLKWYDLPTIQARNAMLPPKQQYIPKKKPAGGVAILPPAPPRAPKQEFFSKNSFQLADAGYRREDFINWTSCDQFAVGAVFSPKDVVNLKWTPFFIWDDNEIDIAREHTFEYPTNKVSCGVTFKHGSTQVLVIGD